MAPVKLIALAAMSLVSNILAVRLLGTHFSGQIYTYELNLSNATAGALSISTKTTGCGVTPTWVYLDESTRTVYCVDESWQGSGVLTQWSLDEKAGSAPKLTGSAVTPGNSVHGSLYGGQDGKSFIVTSEYSPSTFTTYKLPITASTKPIQTLQFTMAAPGPRPDRQDKPHPHSAFTDPTGAYLIVPDLGADLTRIYKINKDTGILTVCPAIKSLPGDGPRHGLFNKAKDTLKYYSLNEVSSSVGVYDVVYPSRNSTNSDCLSLVLQQTVSNYGPSVPLGNIYVKSAEIRIVGDYLYASNRNDTTFGFEQDSIATFQIGASGALTFVELANSYSYYPRSFSFNKAGTYVAIGGQTTANIAIVSRDTETGKLGRLVANVNVPPRGTYGGEDGISSIVWDEPEVSHPSI
ncbi:putative isomerase YbhE [Pleomassaria siparia CBS 279.74]|uniref:Putative isomerase YbhE n=1 Tax=Pleomassaria siparia CBS 279.74 TaxID=1314801 RepID=A0A6G1K8C1_9PLEO|nr:putative isomerase YbhE [Pleomassaria siparia CBS 279.74]